MCGSIYYDVVTRIARYITLRLCLYTAIEWAPWSHKSTSAHTHMLLTDLFAMKFKWDSIQMALAILLFQTQRCSLLHDGFVKGGTPIKTRKIRNIFWSLERSRPTQRCSLLHGGFVKGGTPIKTRKIRNIFWSLERSRPTQRCSLLHDGTSPRWFCQTRLKIGR